MTCGDDNEFHEYSIKNKDVIRTGKIWTQQNNGSGKAYETKKIKSTASTLCDLPSHQQGRAIAYNKKFNHVAVSNNLGDIMVYDYNDFSKLITTLLVAREWVEALKYSPNGSYLAIGAHDDTIYIYSISEDVKYTLHYTVSYVHSSAITALDWSLDSVYLRAIDQAYAKQYYNIDECEQEKEGASTLTKPELWETSTCKLGWGVMGVYPWGTDGSDVNSVDCNKNKTLVAVADDFGTLCIYKYPCLKNSQDCRRISGHSEHVTRARFYENE